MKSHRGLEEVRVYIGEWATTMGTPTPRTIVAMLTLCTFILRICIPIHIWFQRFATANHISLRVTVH